ncbi:AtpZ/AtpI family protein [Frankia sp. Cppng1_Ct_nod]|uniref:AtpZ/AtpI family protein n=1 Tax=Frankia sp. Cppng1_Ct_nod TaxID=2897162 RepID=UPI00104171D5|nr:AtpZ/AtpI family protein [Frankia sp. Cppng1_Ct_nod]
MSNGERNSGDGEGQPERDRPPPRPYRPGVISGEAWSVVGTLLAGTGFWGLVGYGIDRLAGLHTVFLPAGVLVGMAAAVYLVIYRTTRH